MTAGKKETQPRPAARELDLEGWRAWMAERGLSSFRAAQVWHGLHAGLAASWDELTPLPAALRGELAAAFDVDTLTACDVRESADGVRKWLSACRDGERIESVLIPSEDRWTLCVSSQVGCAYGCAFCASGQTGLVRDLTAGEIVDQAVLAARWLRAAQASGRCGPSASDSPDRRHDRPLRPHNLVVMGMGEPLANYDAVLKALRILNAPNGLAIGARHITISTCGLVPGIRRLAGEGAQFELSVSLHAPNDALRARLLPVNQRWPLRELIPACQEYTARTGRIVTFEYTLVRGLNDQPAHARELAALLSSWNCRVNLIPLSPVDEFAGEAPDEPDCLAFQSILKHNRIHTTLRRSRGRQTEAACGQLRLRRMTE